MTMELLGPTSLSTFRKSSGWYKF